MKRSETSRHLSRSALLTLAAGLMTVACASPGGNRAAQEIVVRASDFSFGPATVEVQAGKPVQITLENAGLVDHDWVVKGLRNESAHAAGHGSGHGSDNSIHVHAKAGQRASVRFTPKQAGTYRIVCTEPGHEQVGMVGQLVVRA